MTDQNFTLSLRIDATPQIVFKAILNVRGWWSEEIKGSTDQLNAEFTYSYMDVHRCRIKIIELVPSKRIIWEVLDNYFSFTEDKSEWIGTKIIFEIMEENGQTKLNFIHEGLVPAYECYSACVNGWTQYIMHSLSDLITTGKGQPNGRESAQTTHEVALRFNELAKQEKWFEIQDELFDEHVKSIEPADSPWLKNAEGKAAVRKKAEDWVKKITGAHHRRTTEPIISGDHFAVGREVDIDVNGIGRIQINQIMLYEVKNGRIIAEQFFY